MEKTVKNTGGVAALQKMPKNDENIRQLVTICYQLKGRGQIVTPLQKKEALSGFSITFHSSQSCIALVFLPH